jgi:hypothetical protein
MKTAFFPLRMLSHLPADPTEALAALCAEFDRFDGHARQLPEHHDDYVEALSILKAFALAHDTQLEPLPEVGSQRHQNIANITAFLSQLRTRVRTELAGRHSRGYFESKTEEYRALFAKAQVFEFPEPDFKRILVLAAELRDLISENSLIAEEHKRRLLRRLEAARTELHRRTSDVDRFWSFLFEAGITIRKFGEDLEPISVRALELGKLILKTILTKEGIKALPELADLLVAGVSRAPLLENLQARS